MSATSSSRHRRGRETRRGGRQQPSAEMPKAVWPGIEGGLFKPLSDADAHSVHETVLSLLETVGLSQPISSMVKHVQRQGGQLTHDNRLLFPRSLVDDVIASARRDVVLYGRKPGLELDVSGARVHFGSGGASPSIVDLDEGCYRDATVKDLYDAARLVDTLTHIHLFSRSLVARNAPNPKALDINTAYACVAGTAKHVCISISEPPHVNDIADMCYTISGSEAAFRAQPFMTIMICHVVPPMRFAEEACETIERAILAGFPIQLISAGQAGATSPATIAGSLVQAIAETLAGLVYTYLVDSSAQAIFAPKPLVADLRTGAMSGGSGEQAILMAAAAQMGRFYNLPTSSIAGITDAKIPDAQHGHEKNLAVTLAAHAGSNIITQSCGMQASLLGCSLEGYVIDNDMLGAIMRTVRGVEVSGDNMAADVIRDVTQGEGHYLGHAQTLDRMESDYVYPQIGDRQTPSDWAEGGALDVRTRARQRAKDVLQSHFPNYLDAEVDARLRERFDILLSHSDMGWDE